MNNLATFNRHRASNMASRANHSMVFNDDFWADTHKGPNSHMITYSGPGRDANPSTTVNQLSPDSDGCFRRDFTARHRRVDPINDARDNRKA